MANQSGYWAVGSFPGCMQSVRATPTTIIWNEGSRLIKRLRNRINVFVRIGKTKPKFDCFTVRLQGSGMF
jgi:hypothetical protein